MLMPRRVKYRKQQRGRMSGIAKGGSTIAFGDYALMTEEPGYITSRQIANELDNKSEARKRDRCE